jgi:hypothetical protein
MELLVSNTAEHHLKFDCNYNTASTAREKYIHWLIVVLI